VGVAAMSKKQLFLDHLLFTLTMTKDPVAKAYLETHVKKVKPMTEKQFLSHENNMARILLSSKDAGKVTKDVRAYIDALP
jgi:hypothetical protein